MRKEKGELEKLIFGWRSVVRRVYPNLEMGMMSRHVTSDRGASRIRHASWDITVLDSLWSGAFEFGYEYSLLNCCFYEGFWPRKIVRRESNFRYL